MNDRALTSELSLLCFQTLLNCSVISDFFFPFQRNKCKVFILQRPYTELAGLVSMTTPLDTANLDYL